MIFVLEEQGPYMRVCVQTDGREKVASNGKRLKMEENLLSVFSMPSIDLYAE